MRQTLALICLWGVLSPEDTLEALNTFTCKTMKKRSLCRDCGGWFYLRLELSEEEFHKKINEYKEKHLKKDTMGDV